MMTIIGDGWPQVLPIRSTAIGKLPRNHWASETHLCWTPGGRTSYKRRGVEWARKNNALEFYCNFYLQILPRWWKWKYSNGVNTGAEFGLWSQGEPDLHLHASFTYSNMTVSPYTGSHLSKGTSIFLGACCHPQRFSTFHKQSVSKSYSGVPTKYTQKPTSYHLHCCYPSPSRQHLLLDLCNRVLTDLPPRLFWALQLGPPVKKEVCCCC